MEKPIENPHDISLKFHPLISAKLKTMPSKSHYYKLRQKYLPQSIKLIFLFESPPIRGDYFLRPRRLGHRTALFRHYENDQLPSGL
ncbi:MAG: hypothetical protein PVI62_19190 [Desulfobacterales bacterium]|jgi:hypothetical protein